MTTFTFDFGIGPTTLTVEDSQAAEYSEALTTLGFSFEVE